MIVDFPMPWNLPRFLKFCVFEEVLWVMRLN